jgi:hypothetical protein
VNLTPTQMACLRSGAIAWFEPVGRGWRTCDGLVKRGLMEHNGADRGKGERYRTTEAGKALATPPPTGADGEGEGRR